MSERLREELADSIEELVLVELIAAMKAGKRDAAASLVQRVLDHAEQDALDKTDLKIIKLAFKNIVEEGKALQCLNPEKAKTRSMRSYFQDKNGFLVVQKLHNQGKALADDGAFQLAAVHQHISLDTAKRRYYGYKDARKEWLLPIVKKVLLKHDEALRAEPQSIESIFFYWDCLVETVKPFGVTKSEIVNLIEEMGRLEGHRQKL